jgi:hypothetical protein
MEQARTARVLRGTLVVTLVLVAGSAGALGAVPDETVSLDRLLENGLQRIEAAPDDHEAYYVLGRAYSLAYALSQQEFDVRERSIEAAEGEDASPPPAYALHYPEQVTRMPLVTTLTQLDEARVHYVVDAIVYYRIARDKRPAKERTGLYDLSLGWMFEEGAKFAAEIPFPADPTWKVPQSRRMKADRALANLKSPNPQVRKRTQAVLMDYAGLVAADLFPLLEEAEESERAIYELVLRRAWEEQALAYYDIARDLGRKRVMRYRNYDAVAMEAAQGILAVLQTRATPTATERSETRKLLREIELNTTLPRPTASDDALQP